MSDPATTAATSQNRGRSADGKFAAGNLGGPGNPFARQVAALRKGLLQRITAEDLAEVADALLQKAKKGDVPAAKLLLSYTLGKPASVPNPDRLDLQEWQQFRQEAGIGQQMTSLMESADPRFPIDMVRFMRPLISEKLRMMYGDAFAEVKASFKEPAAPGGQPSPIGKNGKRPQPASEQPGAACGGGPGWFVDMDIVPPSANGNKA